MARIVVVGSGATGVHFALSTLRKGHEVTMLDVGHERGPAVLPDAGIDALKTRLEDPVSYFLGDQCEQVVYPGSGKYYGFPPSKSYVFRHPEAFSSRSSGFEPVFSFARGGLAEAWTGGVYPLNDHELTDFPFGYEDLKPFYAEIARRIGISANRDDLARFSAFDAGYQDPLHLDPHSAALLERYGSRRSRLNQRLGFYLGGSRLATLSRDLGDRKACSHLGRCLWGCPTNSLYSPSVTLRECLAQPKFRYLPGWFVHHFDYGADGRIGRILTESVRDGSPQELEAEVFVLAAGTLCSSKILLESVYRKTGKIRQLTGLMDNRQVMMPFLNLGLIGHPVATESYQFHQLALGIEQPEPGDYVHGQITTLKAAAAHPILQSIPLDLRTAITLFRGVHAALGVANVWLPDRRRSENYLTLRAMASGSRGELVINYSNDGGDRQLVASVIRTLKRAFRELGCVVPPGMTKVLPKGASIHYAGTVPMLADGGELTCAPDGRCRGFPNLYLVDGSGFPFLPAKNLTFTLMANAIRIAEGIQD